MLNFPNSSISPNWSISSILSNSVYFQEESPDESTPASNSSFLELLSENAQLQKKIALLENNESNPWFQKELTARDTKIEDLTKALEDRMSEVQLIEEKSQLQELNEALGEKVHQAQEELKKTQSQLKDARDQADLLEFRVLELEEENEKV